MIDDKTGEVWGVVDLKESLGAECNFCLWNRSMGLMGKICGGCGTELGATEGPTDRVSHGICPECFQNTLKELAS